LPNTVNETNIRFGVHIERNPIILTFMQKMKAFRYTGRGSGIPRMVKACRDAQTKVEFIDDAQSERFTVRFSRPRK
jgi:ATP-dependent DNA helicase RecG